MKKKVAKLKSKKKGPEWQTSRKNTLGKNFRGEITLNEKLDATLERLDEVLLLLRPGTRIDDDGAVDPEPDEFPPAA